MYLKDARYREFAPCEQLQRYVRAFFTFTAPSEVDRAPHQVSRQTLFRDGEFNCTPLFADGHVSIVFSFGPAYRVHDLWLPSATRPSGHVIGAMTVARPASHGERIIQVGAYLGAAQARRFTGVPASELTDRVVALADLWGSANSVLEARLREAKSDSERVAVLEIALLHRIAKERSSTLAIDLAGLARCVRVRAGSLTVQELADAAGVSRQHLTRLFREEVGVTPKLYCRLARFRAGLAYSNGHQKNCWAEVAAQLGYADQSHLIAEFSEFTGLTPGRIMMERRFHPFMESNGFTSSFSDARPL